jgi:hypothetical protein
MNDRFDYKDCKIVDICRGKGADKNTIYARLVDKDGNPLMKAPLASITTFIAVTLK